MKATIKTYEEDDLGYGFISQINRYSRHTNNRTPQLYELYASDALVAPSAFVCFGLLGLVTKRCRNRQQRVLG